MPCQRSLRWRVAVLCVVLAAITFAVFGQTLTHQFVDFDDGEYVSDNPVVAQGLTLKGTVWAFSCHAANWHPLTWLSHELDCQLYGLHPGGHHLTNVLLHTATVIALFLVLRQMTGALWRSAFVAAVFAIHPLRVESVAWLAERKDVLSGLFFMLTIGAYVRYVRFAGTAPLERRPTTQVAAGRASGRFVNTISSRAWGRYGVVMLLFALGLMCKPMVVTLPMVLLLLDYWPLQRMEPRKLPGLVLEKLPLLALSVASGVVTLLAQNKAMPSTAVISVPLRCSNVLVTCMVYLGQMVWPAGLAVIYPYPQNGLPLWEVVLAAVLLAGLSVVAFRQRRKQPWLLMGWLWYLVMLLPVMGVIQVGNQAHADRYTYLPLIGIYMALTWLAGSATVPVALAGVTPGSPRAKKAFGETPKTASETLALPILAVAILAVLMVCAWKQTGYWQDSETLWRHTAASTTDNAMGHYSLGDALSQKGSEDEAITQYQMALQIMPDFVEAHDNLGVALLEKGRLDEAITQFKMALQIKPGNPKARNNLGFALIRKGSVDEAIHCFQQALEIKPDYVQARVNLGNAFLQKGNTAEAIAHFQKVLQIDPGNPVAQNNLAWLLATCGEAALRNGNKAVELARQANAQTGGTNPKILHTLAAAYAEAGQFSNARESAQKAMALARAAGQQDLAAQLNDELKRYEAGLPLHQ